MFPFVVRCLQDNHLSFICCKAGKAIAQIHGKRGESSLHLGEALWLITLYLSHGRNACGRYFIYTKSCLFCAQVGLLCYRLADLVISWFIISGRCFGTFWYALFHPLKVYIKQIQYETFGVFTILLSVMILHLIFRDNTFLIPRLLINSYFGPCDIWLEHI